MTRVLLTAVLISVFYRIPLNAGEADGPIEPSYFKLTTSNGLLAAVYDAKKNVVEYVFPHIFENYDSARFVRPFVGNIRLKSEERPADVRYLANTHVIAARYRDFTLQYFASFTRADKIFYIVARGKKQMLAGLSFDAESGRGNVLTGVSLLTNSQTDLSVRLGGALLTGSVSRRYRGEVYERYFLYSFTDSLHTDTAVVTRALADLALPGSVNLLAAGLFGKENAQLLGERHKERVFVDERGDAARRAALLAVRLGYENVRVLDAGLEGLRSTILDFKAPAAPPPAAEADTYRFRAKAGTALARMIEENKTRAARPKPAAKKIVGGC